MKCKLSKLFFLALIGAFSLKGYSQTESERKQIVKDYDLKQSQKFIEELSHKFQVNFAKGLEIAKQRGLPLEGVDQNGRYFSIKGYDEELDKVIYYQAFNNGVSNSSVQTARAQHLYQGGALGINIQGQGMNLGIWDGGQPQASHQNLGLDRVINKDGQFTTTSGQDGIDHATHVAGTMIGSGVGEIKARGIAFSGNLWSNTWTNDLVEMAEQASAGLLVSNHSYGINNQAYLGSPEVFGRYNSEARDLDRMLNLYEKYLPVYAAGNDRQGVYVSGNSLTPLNPAKNGYDLMVNETVAKNAVVVAAIYGMTDYTTANDVQMSDFSQWGPTDDFRVKPDISAKGVDVYSSNMPSPSSVNSYGSYPGTSMAAPAVTAVFALWQQYFKVLWPTKISMRSASLRALMAHTANDAGLQGPDPKFGWGVINAEGGAQVLKDAKSSLSVFKEVELNSGQEYVLNVVLDGTMPLTATIAWLDKEGQVVSSADSTIPVLVNDLDMRVVRPNQSVLFPWSLKKSYAELVAVANVDNNVDNIEKIEYKGLVSGTAAAGVYQVKVSHKGSSLVGGKQKFTLVVSGGVVDFYEGTVSVENSKIESLRIYPNPAKDIINISAEMGALENANVAIFDMLGKKVYESDQLFLFSGEASVDVSGLVSGVYLFEVLKDGKKDVRKIVIK